jgi:hypothetical protein
LRLPKPPRLCLITGNRREVAISAAVRLREDEDYEGQHLRALTQASRDANQTRRLLALAAIYDGGSRGVAAAIGGVGLQPFDRLRSARLGLGVHCRGPGRAEQRQGAWQAAAARYRTTPRAGTSRRGGADPVGLQPTGLTRGGAWSGALAADRSGTMGVRPARHCDQQTDPEPRTARSWLPQTVGPAASSGPEPAPALRRVIAFE